MSLKLNFKVPKNLSMNKDAEKYYDKIAPNREKWRNRNSFYHSQLSHLYSFLVPKHQKILEIGCGTGGLLADLSPSYGVGVDISQEMLKIARKKYKKLKFIKGDAQNLSINKTFDYVILSDLIGNLSDIQVAFEQLHKVTDTDSRIIISYYNHYWEPIIVLLEGLGLKMKQPIQNWLSSQDIRNILNLANLELIKEDRYLLLPLYIPVISSFINKYIARFPVIKRLCLVKYFVVRKEKTQFINKDYSVSLIIPARNEKGNIENAIRSIPRLGKHTQLVFVEGHSRDGTRDEILKMIEKYKKVKDIILVKQNKTKGKADAVRRGIKQASGEIIIIFDADLTVSPQDLPKFYQALKSGKAEFVQGCRLIYPMEKQAMRMLNIMGNKFFGLAFSFLLDQPIKDTLCGTKAIFYNDYIKIEKNRAYFGDFDPFGDFDLIFGAA